MISNCLRIILVVASVVMCLYVFRKVRKYQMQIEDTIFWIFTAICLVVLSIFPQIAISTAIAIGVSSPVNFVFLIIIFILMIKVFLLSIKVSQLEYKIRTLVQEEGIKSYKQDSNYKVGDVK